MAKAKTPPLFDWRQRYNMRCSVCKRRIAATGAGITRRHNSLSGQGTCPGYGKRGKPIKETRKA